MDGVCVMAKGGIARFTVDFKDFDGKLNVVLNKVDRGTRKATEAMSKEIMDNSLQQVPRDTSTIAKSAYRVVSGNSKQGFQAEFGYGGNGNPRNPKTGAPASQYMVVVHEDLSAKHKIGKAKFLEDPVRQYQAAAAGKYAKFLRNEGF